MLSVSPLSFKIASLWNCGSFVTELLVKESSSPYLSTRRSFDCSANLCRSSDTNVGTETLGLRHLLGMNELRTGRLAAMQPKKRSMTVQISAWEDSPVREALVGAV